MRAAMAESSNPSEERHWGLRVAQLLTIMAGSRFSGLKIEDDSDEDAFTAILRGKKTSGPAQASKKGAKAKHPHKKTTQEVTAAEWEAMEEREAKAVFEADLRRAIEESRITAQEHAVIQAALHSPEKGQTPEAAPGKAAPAKSKKKKKGPQAQPAEEARSSDKPGLVAETEAEVARVLSSEEGRGGGAVESVLLAVYRDKLDKAANQIQSLETDAAKLQDDAKKYKDRYKKLCELLKETEVKEKAELVVAVEKSAAVREELAAEIERLSAELARKDSHIHALTAQLVTRPSHSAE